MIWCVEDDAGIREIETYTLQSTGFQARGFEDGAAFQAALRTQRPELIILDVMLPGKDGVTLLRELKKEGVWVFGAAMEGAVSLYQADLKGPAAIVIGGEGQGVSALVKKECDYVVRIPQKGKIPSLNASNAAAVLLYEAVRKRQ